MALEEKYLVEFELSSPTITPGEISKKTGLMPTFALEKGEEIRHKKTGAVIRKAETNRWEIASDLPAGSEVERQFGQLLDKLRPHKEYLVSLLKKAECVWEISGDSYDISGQVWLNLPAAVLQELNDYHCEIIVDIYLRAKNE
jgi:hypothetical protein